MREINEAGIALVKAFEGFRNNIYFDIAGIRTIGYGHMVRPGQDFTNGLDESGAESLLRADLRIAYRSIARLITVPLTDNQYAALCSFTFNLGGAALQRSTLRRKINRGENPLGEWPKWSNAAGRPSKGLLRRRLAEQALYISS